ncbi:hypothetical protein ACFO5R_13375 [Halosolutus amylolyticus]|uniref:DUF8144 domain-containing protein n=1 Tax=Halosolutus amylolyticus TaxID=2932267 RepID=A0ABD5PR40_9EURY|nr:hypothetical protein [Halosolutus amylolyticus]
MSNTTIVDFIEEWQTGFFLMLGSLIAGSIGGVLFGQVGLNTIGGFVVGVLLTFLGASYVLYGR